MRVCASATSAFVALEKKPPPSPPPTMPEEDVEVVEEQPAPPDKKGEQEEIDEFSPGIETSVPRKEVSKTHIPIERARVDSITYFQGNYLKSNSQ